MSVTEAPPLEEQAVAEQDEASAGPEPATATDVRKMNAGPEALALPPIDGQDIDRIELNFSGSVRLDRSDPADVALFRALRMGQQVDVRVAGVAAGKDGRVSYDEDGYPGETTAKAKIKVTTVFRPVGDGAVARVGSDQTELVEE